MKIQAVTHSTFYADTHQTYMCPLEVQKRRNFHATVISKCEENKMKRCCCQQCTLNGSLAIVHLVTCLSFTTRLYETFGSFAETQFTSSFKRFKSFAMIGQHIVTFVSIKHVHKISFCCSKFSIKCHVSELFFHQGRSN